MGKVRSKATGEDPHAEIQVKAKGDQTSVTIDGDEYEVEADGTLTIELRHLPEFEAHGFERVAAVRASNTDKTAPAKKK